MTGDNVTEYKIGRSIVIRKEDIEPGPSVADLLVAYVTEFMQNEGGKTEMDDTRVMDRDWAVRVGELRAAQDMICREALLRKPADSFMLEGWTDCALTMFNIIQDRINELTPMTDKPFTED